MNEVEKNRCENCIIRKFNSLNSLSKEDLKEFSDKKITKKIQKGAAIFKEGEKLNGIYCMRNGISKLSKLNENGNSQIIKIVGKGDILGHRSIITNENANLGAVAMEDTEVCFIPRNLISEKVDSNISFTKSLLESIATELKQVDNQLIDMSQKDVPQRLAITLLYLHNKFGEDNEGFLKIKFSREDLASLIGTATESCIRNISILKKRGLISTKGKKIQINDSEKLRRIT